jgi:hypothetical protein
MDAVTERKSCRQAMCVWPHDLTGYVCETTTPLCGDRHLLDAAVRPRRGRLPPVPWYPGTMYDRRLGAGWVAATTDHAYSDALSRGHSVTLLCTESSSAIFQKPAAEKSSRRCEDSTLSRVGAGDAGAVTGSLGAPQSRASPSRCLSRLEECFRSCSHSLGLSVRSKHQTNHKHFSFFPLSAGGPHMPASRSWWGLSQPTSPPSPVSAGNALNRP